MANNKTERATALCAELEFMLRLKTFPVGLRRVARMEELEGTGEWKTCDHHPTGCQLIALARTVGWAFALTKDNIHLCGFASAIGLGEEQPSQEVSPVVGTWFKTQQDAEKWRAGYPRVRGKIEALLMAPASRKMFEPEVIWLYSSPSQMILLINAIQWADYERLQFS